MAYVSQQIPENEQNLFGKKDETTPTPIPPQTGGSSGAGTGAGGGAAPGQATSTQFGSNAARLSDYLSANAPQVQQFGQKVAGNLTEGYNKTMGDISQGLGQFGQQIQQGYAQANPELVNQATQNPTEFVKNPENVTKFKSLYNDQYMGPQNFEGSDIYSNLNANVNKAVENASLINSSPGLQSYLSNYLGTGTNTPGMQTLDNLLLQRSPEAYGSIKQAAAPYKGLGDYLSSATQQQNADIQKAIEQAQGTSQGLRQQFTGEGGIIPSFQSDVTGRLGNAQTDYEARNAAIQNSGPIPSSEFASLFGISPEQVQTFTHQGELLKNLYGLSPGDVFSSNFTNAGAPSVQGIMSPDEAARAQALSTLTGSDLSSYYNNGPVGTYQAPNVNIPGALQTSRNDLRQADMQFISQQMNIPPQQDPTFSLKRALFNNNFLNDPANSDMRNPSQTTLAIQNAYNTDPNFQKFVQAANRDGNIDFLNKIMNGVFRTDIIRSGGGTVSGNIV